MKRSLVLIPLIAVVACTVDDTQTMVVIQNQLVDRAMAMCQVPTTQTASASTEGVLDVGLVDVGFGGYTLFPLVKSLLASTINMAAGAQTDITLTGANIELVPETPDVASKLTARKYFVHSFGGTISPGQVTALALDALPTTVVKQFSSVINENTTGMPVIVIRAQVTGTHAGDTITSNWFEFPVKMCRWCLTGGPPAACVPFKTSEVQLGACQPEMDDAVTCCTQNGKYLCGPDVPMAQ